MTESQVLDTLQSAIWTILIGASPVLASALAIGLFIAFFQALTQIQEMTLTFVPKIVGIFLVLSVSISFIYSQVASFFERVMDMIAKGGL